MSPRDPLVRTLTLIEDRVEDNLTVGELSRAAYVSASHLQRLFSLTMGQPLMAYVRGRKLAASLEALLGSRSRVIEIAHRYGFGHEQSYIRAFRKEFGCTPGFARERRPILPVRERIDPDSLSTVGQGLLCGPRIAMVPSFHIVGRRHLFEEFDDERDALEPNRIAVQFAMNDVTRIPHVTQPPTYIGLCTQLGPPGGDVEYVASAQVERIDHVPAGLQARTLPTRLCVAFRYVGEHPAYEITMATAKSLYTTIDEFFARPSRYRVAENWFFERIDTSCQDETFCLMEWLRPVTEE